jgi:hypothetical protein
MHGQILPLQWARGFGGNGSENATQIAIDVSGNIYCTGYFSGTNDFDPGPGTFTLASNGGYDAYVNKLDAQGNFVWAKSWGGAQNDYGSSVIVNNAGDVFICGIFYNAVDFDPGPGMYMLASNGQSDCYVLNLDNSGNFQWAGSFGASPGDVASAMCFDTTGNLVIGGYFGGSVDFDPGAGVYSVTSNSNSPDAYILNLSPSGSFGWVKTFGGTNTDRISRVAVDSAGNIYSTGSFWELADFDPGPAAYTLNVSSNTQCNVFVTKFNPTGNFIWAVSFRGDSFDYSSGIKLDQFGNVYTVGSLGGNTDLDPGPGTYVLGAGSGQDCFISKLDNNGNFVWARHLANYGGGTSLAIDAANNLFISGSFNGGCDFDPGPGTHTINSQGYSDGFILNLDPTGNFLAVSVISGTNGEVVNDIKLTNAGDIICSGSRNADTDFDPTAATYTISNPGYMYIAKYGSVPTGLTERQQIMSDFAAYPNPFANKIDIEISDHFDLSNAEISVYSTLGSLMYSQKINKPHEELNLETLPSGIYYLKIIAEEYSRTLIVSKQ